MVLAARRAYRDANRWMKGSRARGPAAWRLTRSAFWGTLLAALGVMALIGVVAPSGFGLPGRNTLRSGWPSLVLIAIVLACLLYALLRRDQIAWLVRRAAEPFRRPLTEHPAYDPASGALSSCPAFFQIRFFVAWVVAPTGLAALAGIAAFSVAYFIVDALLARFRVGVGHPVFAIANAWAGVLLFRLAAARLSTWRLGLSVYKSVRTGYP